MKRKSVIFTLILLLAAGFTQLEQTTVNAAGNGTSQNPFVISTAEQFLSIKDNLSASYSLSGDIDLSKMRNPSPIGTEARPFTGNFNGNGYTISGILYEGGYTEKNCFIGLFGYSSGEIKNLTLRGKIIVNNYYNSKNTLDSTSNSTGSDCEETVITTLSDGTEKISVIPKASGGSISSAHNGYIESETYVGGLVGYNKGTISNIKNNVEITVKGNGTIYCGGIAGYNINGIIENCANNAKLSSYTGESGFIPDVNFGRNYCGGIVGYSYTGKLSRCDNYADIRSYNGLQTKTSYACAGGIIGNSEWGKTELKNCSNSGSIYALCESNYNCGRALAGGLSGGFRGSAILCANKGDVFAENTNYGGANAGGIAATASGEILNCFNSGNVKSKKVSGNAYAPCNSGGIVGGLYSDEYFDIYSKMENCGTSALNVEATGPMASAGRILGTTGKSVTIANNFALNTSKVNGATPASDTGANGNNGKSVSDSELSQLFKQ